MVLNIGTNRRHKACGMPIDCSPVLVIPTESTPESDGLVERFKALADEMGLSYETRRLDHIVQENGVSEQEGPEFASRQEVKSAVYFPIAFNLRTPYFVGEDIIAFLKDQLLTMYESMKKY